MNGRPVRDTVASERPPEADRALPLPRGLLVLLSVTGAVVSVAGLRAASGIVGPAFLALMIVITIHPLLAWLQRHRVPGWLAVGLTMLVAYASLLALAAALALSVARLATLIPSYQPAVHQPRRPGHRLARQAGGHLRSRSTPRSASSTSTASSESCSGC